jgi:hypothetical protein
MANTQGSLENPFCIDDVEPPRPPRSDKAKAKAYYELHDDRPPTELPVDAIPTNSRARDKGKSRRDSNNPTTSDHATTFRRSSDSTTNRTSRTPAKPGIGHEIITIDDDGPSFTPQSASTRRESSTMSSDAKAVVPSGSGTHAASRTPSLPLSGFPANLQAWAQVASTVVEKETITPPPSRLAYLLANSTTHAPNVTTPAERPEGPWRGSAPISHTRDHVGNSDKTSPHSGNAAPLHMTVHRPLDPPIGARADSGREQATSRHVETNATSIPARINDINEGRNTISSPEVPERARKSADLLAPRLSSKPRAIKTASSAPWRTSGRADYHPAKQNANPLSSGPVPKEDSHSDPVSRSVSRPVSKPISRPVSIERSVHDRSPETSNDISGREEENLQLDQVVPDPKLNASPTGPVSALPDVNSTAMGAHSSTPTDESLPLPPSDTSREDESAQSPQSNPVDSRTHDVDVAAITQNHFDPTEPETTEHTERMVSLSELHGDAEKDIGAARRKIEVTLRHHLDERYEDHAYLVKNLMWRQRTRYERATLAQANQFPTKRGPMLPEKYLQTDSPFKNMPVVQSLFQKSSHRETEEVITQDIFTNIKSGAKDNVAKSTWSVLKYTHKPENLQIPSFKEYVSLRTSILADNESKILTLPWMGDDEPEERLKTLVEDLPKAYEIRHDINALLDLRDEQCRFYSDPFNSFLEDVGVSWDTILYWLLSSEKHVRRINQRSDKHSEFERLVLDRVPHDRDAFRRDGQELEPILFQCDPERWDSLLHQIGEPSAVQLRLAALSCAALIANCGFSTWYMAKHAKTMTNYIQSRINHTEAASKFAFRNIMCRVCHEHNCLFHGEIREGPGRDLLCETNEESSEDGLEIGETHKSTQRTKSSHAEKPKRENNKSDKDGNDSDGPLPVHYDSDDSDIEKVVNYRFPANSIVSTNVDSAYKGISKRPIPPAGKFNPKWWETNTNTVHWENRKPFVPCSHDGSCVEAKCRCFRENVTCEKTCKCPSECNRRFPGCQCASIEGKRICATATGCLCIKFKRECDADLCGTCGATEILDPVNRYNEELLQDQCSNVGIQRRVPKKTLLGKSEVHGFGLYAGQDMRKDDVIGEYTGEILSRGESIRREVVYVFQKNMYLFNLNKGRAVVLNKNAHILTLRQNRR